MMPLINRELDLRGFCEPIPLISTNQAIDELNDGDVLLVITTDRGTLKDFDVWCQQTGNLLLQSSEQDSEFTFLICKHPGLN